MQIRPLGTDLTDGDMKNLICTFRDFYELV